MSTTPKRRTIAATLVALLVAAVTVLSAAAPSSAVAVVGPSGYRGTVWRNGAMITGYDTQAYAFVFTTDGVTVASSNASSNNQLIGVIYSLQQGSGSRWTTIASTNTMSGVAVGSGSGSLRFGSWQYTLPSTPSFAYGYRIVATISWVDASTGRGLGSESVVPSLNGEAVCHTTWRRCTSYADGLVM